MLIKIDSSVFDNKIRNIPATINRTHKLIEYEKTYLARLSFSIIKDVIKPIGNAATIEAIRTSDTLSLIIFINENRTPPIINWTHGK